MRHARLVFVLTSAATAAALAFACTDSDNNGPGGADAASADSTTNADVSNPQNDGGSGNDAGGDTGSPVDGSAGDGGVYLYFADNNGAGIRGFSIAAATGAIAALDMDLDAGGSQPSISTGLNPLGVAALPNGKFLYSAHTSGDIGTFAIDPATGALTHVDVDGTDAGVQDFHPAAGLHFYSIVADPQGRYIHALHSNLEWQIVTMSVNPTTGALTLVKQTDVAVSAARALAIDPQAHFIWVVGSNLSPTVMRVALDNAGLPIAADAGGAASTTLPGSANCTNSALGAAGRVYTACGQDQALHGVEYDAGANVAFSVGTANAGFVPIGVAVHPSNTFAYAASFTQGAITTFSLAANGAPTALPPPLGVSAQCRTLAFYNGFLYAGCDGKMLSFSVNGTTGALTPVANVPGVSDSSYSMAFVRP